MDKIQWGPGITQMAKRRYRSMKTTFLYKDGPLPVAPRGTRDPWLDTVTEWMQREERETPQQRSPPQTAGEQKATAGPSGSNNPEEIMSEVSDGEEERLLASPTETEADREDSLQTAREESDTPQPSSSDEGWTTPPPTLSEPRTPQKEEELIHTPPTLSPQARPKRRRTTPEYLKDYEWKNVNLRYIDATAEEEEEDILDLGVEMDQSFLEGEEAWEDCMTF